MDVASTRRVAGILVVAVVYGLATAWLKGNNAGLRDTAPTVSLPGKTLESASEWLGSELASAQG